MPSPEPDKHYKIKDDDENLPTHTIKSTNLTKMLRAKQNIAIFTIYIPSQL